MASLPLDDHHIIIAQKQHSPREHYETMLNELNRNNIHLTPSNQCEVVEKIEFVKFVHLHISTVFHKLAIPKNEYN